MSACMQRALSCLCFRCRLRSMDCLYFVLFEGWGTAGKGSVLGKVIKNIDPRFFKVATMDEPTEEERRKPFYIGIL